MAKKDRGIDVLESSAVFHSVRELPKDYAKTPSQQANNDTLVEISGCNPIKSSMFTSVCYLVPLADVKKSSARSSFSLFAFSPFTKYLG